MCSLKQQFVEELSSIGFLPAGLSRAVFSRREKSAIDQVLTVTGPKVREETSRGKDGFPFTLCSTVEREWRELPVALVRPLRFLLPSTGARDEAGPAVQQERIRGCPGRPASDGTEVYHAESRNGTFISFKLVT